MKIVSYTVSHSLHNYYKQQYYPLALSYTILIVLGDDYLHHPFLFFN